MEKINELVEDLGTEVPRARLRLRRGKVYKPVVVPDRDVQASGCRLKLDRNPLFIRKMMRYGERRAREFFRTLAFEEAWTSGNPDAVLGYFSEEAGDPASRGAAAPRRADLLQGSGNCETSFETPGWRRPDQPGEEACGRRGGNVDRENLPRSLRPSRKRTGGGRGRSGVRGREDQEAHPRPAVTLAG